MKLKIYEDINCNPLMALSTARLAAGLLSLRAIIVHFVKIENNFERAERHIITPISQRS